MALQGKEGERHVRRGPACRDAGCSCPTLADTPPCRLWGVYCFTQGRGHGFPPPSRNRGCRAGCDRNSWGLSQGDSVLILE